MHSRRHGVKQKMIFVKERHMHCKEVMRINRLSRQIATPLGQLQSDGRPCAPHAIQLVLVCGPKFFTELWDM